MNTCESTTKLPYFLKISNRRLWKSIFCVHILLLPHFIFSEYIYCSYWKFLVFYFILSKEYIQIVQNNVFYTNQKIVFCIKVIDFPLIFIQFCFVGATWLYVWQNENNSFYHCFMYSGLLEIFLLVFLIFKFSSLHCLFP